ncbi:MAG: methyltransferase domain-containing protein, partial [Proteobacteria bacterium]
MKRILFALALAGCTSAQKVETPVAAPAPAQVTTVEQAVASPYRTEANRARDAFRHPVETLNFFGIEPQMTVVEVIPGRGWYTEILAPLLSAHGRYVGAVMGAAQLETNEQNKPLNDWMKANPAVSAPMQIVDLNFDATPNLGADGSADAVVTFRNFHNFMGKKNDMKALKAFFNVLKPGGILGIVDHRA